MRVCARWTETEQMRREREREVCARAEQKLRRRGERERERCVCARAEQKLSRCGERERGVRACWTETEKTRREREMCVRALNRNWADRRRERREVCARAGKARSLTFITFKCISFKILQHVKIVFNTWHNIPQVIMRKFGFINRHYGPANHTLY